MIPGVQKEAGNEVPKYIKKHYQAWFGNDKYWMENCGNGFGSMLLDTLAIKQAKYGPDGVIHNPLDLSLDKRGIDVNLDRIEGSFAASEFGLMRTQDQKLPLLMEALAIGILTESISCRRDGRIDYSVLVKRLKSIRTLEEKGSDAVNQQIIQIIENNGDTPQPAPTWNNVVMGVTAFAAVRVLSGGSESNRHTPPPNLINTPDIH